VHDETAGVGRPRALRRWHHPVRTATTMAAVSALLVLCGPSAGVAPAAQPCTTTDSATQPPDGRSVPQCSSGDPSATGAPGERDSGDAWTGRRRSLHPADEPSGNDAGQVSGDRAGTAEPAGRPLGPAGTWNLAFSDEFTGDHLDARTWIPCVSAGWTAAQAPQPCTAVSGTSESYHPGNAAVGDGELHLVAEPDRDGGYRSGAVSTADNAFGFPQPGFRPFSYTYGFLEVRLRAPTAPGMWPAVWQMPVGGGGHDEMDLMEYIRGYAYMTLHGPQAAGNPVWGQAQVQVPDLATSHHVFGADWEPGRLTWYLDGRQVGSTTRGVPSVPEFVQANLQIGGLVGPSGPDQRWPVSMDVDYVRVYQRPAS
jgi:hypothetical protein